MGANDPRQPGYRHGPVRFGLLIAEAGGPYVINEPGGSVTLTGSGTGTGLIYEWDFNGNDFSSIEATGQTAIFTTGVVDGPTSFTVWLRSYRWQRFSGVRLGRYQCPKRGADDYGEHRS